jgi:hypothetical protein
MKFRIPAYTGWPISSTELETVNHMSTCSVFLYSSLPLQQYSTVIHDLNSTRMIPCKQLLLPFIQLQPYCDLRPVGSLYSRNVRTIKVKRLLHLKDINLIWSWFWKCIHVYTTVLLLYKVTQLLKLYYYSVLMLFLLFSNWIKTCQFNDQQKEG